MNDFERCDYYLRVWLPGRLNDSEKQLLLSVGVPVSICLRDKKEETDRVLLQTADGLTFPTDQKPACRYVMTPDTFLRICGGHWSPQRALFTGKLRIEGDKRLAVRFGSLLDSIFHRIPWDGKVETDSTFHELESSQSLELTDHQREVIRLHAKPEGGASWWIERFRENEIDPDSVYTFKDLAPLGLFDRELAARRSWRDFIPSSVLRREDRIILGETGGTTGPPMTSPWIGTDFQKAFVDPLVGELNLRGLNNLNQWLFVGPTGPHIIGKAADALAQATTGVDALKIDFDPRWHRAMMPGSTAAIRHMEHLIRQAVLLLDREKPDALFITPSVLRVLLEDHRDDWISKLLLVHLGGQSIDHEQRNWLVENLPDNCLLINGYGNSLFGCMVENAVRPLTYIHDGGRLVVEILGEENNLNSRASVGESGQVMFHRFDESMMILNAVERDEADRCAEGIHFPRPMTEASRLVAGGVY